MNSVSVNISYLYIGMTNRYKLIRDLKKNLNTWEEKRKIDIHRAWMKTIETFKQCFWEH